MVFNSNSDPRLSQSFSTVPTSTEPVETTSIIEIDWGKLKINEFVSDPVEGNEWVEFYNFSSTSVDLSGALLCDNRETTGCLSLSGEVSSMGWLYFDLETRSFLNNGGDNVLLRNPSGEIVDRVDYDELPPGKGQSLSRRVDGEDTDNINDWAITITLTPGASNVINEPVTSSGNANNVVKNQTSSAQDKFFSTTSTYFGQVVFNEILPYPEGDNQEEFVEIKNVGANPVSLFGWTFEVDGKYYNLSDIIFINELKVLFSKSLNFSLNNSGGKIALYDSGGYLAANLSYNKLKSGVSLARDASGDWIETAKSTPGTINEFFTESGASIFWRVDSPDSVSVGEQAEFFVGNSLDPRGGKLFFVWQVNNKEYSGEKLSLVFENPGEVKIKIVATSTAGSYGEKEIVLLVGAGLIENDFGVGLSEVCPNPTSGQEDEFVELHNYSLAETDISGWRLRYLGHEYQFPEGTVIDPGTFLVFYRPVSKLILDDKAGEVELLDTDLNVLDKIDYLLDKKGECLILFNNEWQKSVSSTPGQENNLVIEKTAETALKKVLTVKAGSTAGSATKSVAGIKDFSLYLVRGLEKGVAVRISGVVSVLPGIFGTQFFYIFDGLSGMQIYQNKKLFPDLRVGDLISVSGEVSESSGRKRVNVKSIDGFDILSVENQLEPIVVDMEKLNDEMFGSLLKISGEITELKTSYLYLDDGFGELAVYFKPGANIDKKDFKEGMKVEATGVYENSASGGQLWPRDRNDIKIIFEPTAQEEVYEMSVEQTESPVKELFLTLLAVGGALVLGFVLREKGVIWFNKIKKILNKKA